MNLAVQAKTLIDGTGRDPVHSVSIIVEDGKIARVVSPRVSVDADRFQVVDAEEGVVLPGLIDSHCHVFCIVGGPRKARGEKWEPDKLIALVANGLEGARRWLLQGITTVRNAAMATNMDLGLRDLVAQGKAIGPRIFGAGRPITIPGRPLTTGKGHEVSGPDDARRAAREQLRSGADLIKLFASAGVGGAYGEMIGEAGWEMLTVEEMAAAVFEAHKAGRPATAHAINTASIKNALQAGVDSIEHCTYLDEEGLAMMKERDVVMIPTLAITEVLASRGTEFGFGPHMERHARACVENGRLSVRMAHQANIRIAVGTDPTRPLTIVDEIQLLNRAGLTPMEVIIAATRIGAELLGVQDRLGTVEPGKVADLMIIDGNPLDDLQALGSVRCVIKEGKIVKSPVT